MRQGSRERRAISSIRYRCAPYIRRAKQQPSISVLGLDTEAWSTGQCFMVASSLGDVWSYTQFPSCLFARRYRNRSYVCYNLSYDESAILQTLPLDCLQTLRAGAPAEWQGYTYRSIPKKCLTISRGRNAVHIYDLYNFYSESLEAAAQKYLGYGKIALPTKTFDPDYVTDNWAAIGQYCVRDAKIVEALAQRIIERFETLGVHPRKLYSIAYVSYQYFASHTPYVTVRRYWQRYKPLLQAAMDSYSGGKFEVTEKGCGHYWEYDINSAYPYEIANLIDISWARVEQTPRYQKSAIYGFLYIAGKLPVSLHSPVAVKYNSVNVYPVGYLRRWITLAEYDWLTSHGADLTIKDAWWIKCDNRCRPYRREVLRLATLKDRAKREGRELDYHTIKVLLNSLYGKMIQLIPQGEGWLASTAWNPIYGSIITANVRLRVSDLQQRYPQVCAVHTDSVISSEPLPLPPPDGLGSFAPTARGYGVILGSGIYQIGDKVRFRGFASRRSLLALLDHPQATVSLDDLRVHSWREVAFHGWPTSLINRFETLPRQLRVDFDRKRVWLDDWRSFSEVPTRRVESLPHYLLPWGF